MTYRIFLCGNDRRMMGVAKLALSQAGGQMIQGVYCNSFVGARQFPLVEGSQISK